MRVSGLIFPCSSLKCAAPFFLFFSPVGYMLFGDNVLILLFFTSFKSHVLVCNIIHWTTARDLCMPGIALHVPFFLSRVFDVRNMCFLLFLPLISFQFSCTMKRKSDRSGEFVACVWIVLGMICTAVFFIDSIQRCAFCFLPLHGKELMDAQRKYYNEVKSWTLDHNIALQIVMHADLLARIEL